MIDPVSELVINTLTVNAANLCFFDGTSVWVISTDGVNSFATQIDPIAQTISNTYDFHAGTSFGGVCSDGTNIWVSMTNQNLLTRFVAATGVPVGDVALGAGIVPQGICFDGTNIWSINGGTVSKVTAATGTFINNYPVASPSFLTGQGIAFAAGNIWASTQGSNPDFIPALVKVNPATGAVLDTIPLAVTPPTVNGATLESVNFDGTNLWIVDGSGNNGDNAVFVVDPLTDAVLAFFNTLTDGNPLYLTFTPGGQVWVANTNFPTLSVLSPVAAPAGGSITGTFVAVGTAGRVFGGTK